MQSRTRIYAKRGCLWIPSRLEKAGDDDKIKRNIEQKCGGPFSPIKCPQALILILEIYEWRKKNGTFRK